MKYSLALLLISSSLMASIGKVTAIRGSAELLRGTQEIPVKKGTELEEHDRIKTGNATKLQILFNDKTVISLGRNSDFSIDEYLYDDQDVEARFSVGRGFFKSITGKIGKIAPSHFRVRTANATIGVRGTTIIGEVHPRMDIIACTYGRIVVTTPQGSVIVNEGERTVVAHAKAPAAAQRVNRIILRQLDRKSDPTASTPSDASAEKLPVKQTHAKKIEDADEKKKEETKRDRLEQGTRQAAHTLDDIREVTGTQTPRYEGRVTEGMTSYGTIRQDSTNEVKLGFDLGAGTMQGDMRFSDPVQQYDIEVGGSVKEDGSFDFNSQNGYDGGGNGKISGEKYEHANGRFDFQEHDLFGQHTNEIRGEFETKRQ